MKKSIIFSLLLLFTISNGYLFAGDESGCDGGGGIPQPDGGTFFSNIEDGVQEMIMNAQDGNEWGGILVDLNGDGQADGIIVGTSGEESSVSPADFATLSQTQDGFNIAGDYNGDGEFQNATVVGFDHVHTNEQGAVTPSGTDSSDPDNFGLGDLGSYFTLYQQSNGAVNEFNVYNANSDWSSTSSFTPNPDNNGAFGLGIDMTINFDFNGDSPNVTETISL